MFYAKHNFNSPAKLIMENIQTGKIGEEIAGKYLVDKGYLILARNHKERFDEIDIIARSPSGILIFCEVKTISNRMGLLSSFMPEDNLSAAKLKKITRGSLVFLAKHPELVKGNEGWQIDLIAITLQEGNPAILHHYENI
jgi:putative endonuclease